MGHWVVVAAGGALGAVARYLVTGATHRLVPGTFPIGTTTVNVVGGLLVGLLAGLLAARDGGADHLAQLFFIVGVCGGFTTYSAFSLESVRLLQAGATGTVMVSAGLQVFGSLAATAAGLWIARHL